MKLLILLIVLFSAGNAQSQYELGKKNDFLDSYMADIVCLNNGMDSLTLVHKEEKTTISLDSVNYLTMRKRKDWWPYLLASTLVGVSTYTVFRLTGRDDAMYSAEGKARFLGFLSGGIVLTFGAMIKGIGETQIIIHSGDGIYDTEALIICAF